MKLWRVEFPDNNVFLKLHHLSHLIKFLEEWGFCGIRSEEGCEAFHPFLALLLQDLKPMASTQARCQTESTTVFQFGWTPEFKLSRKS
jgi:hypothetical protein